MSVTIKDVSNHASVSIKTVSRVINNEKNVAEATKSKVLASIKKLGFKPNKSAQSLRSKRSYMIALLYDNPNKSYLADIQNGILQVCKKSGYNFSCRSINSWKLWRSLAFKNSWCSCFNGCSINCLF